MKLVCFLGDIFNPSLNQLPYVKAVKCEISETLTKLVLCLPLYPELDGNIQKNIVNNL
jgi:dTDP-4-amino-4,6-dideoxygalactose transaminase